MSHNEKLMNMETNINIVEILKDKPQGTKLYSSACGKCKLEEVDDKSFKISFYNSKFGFMNGGEGHLDKNGKLYDDGECVVFPSKEMRDWHKFAWKKGDVLISNDGNKRVFFNGFTDDTYALFKAKHGLEVLSNGNIIYLGNEDGIATSDYTLEDKDVAQTYINTIERRLGGKLNRETLEVEKYQPEFKDGDIVVYGKSVAICRKFYKHTLCFYVSLNEMFGLLFDDEVESSEEYRFATEEEKRLLFNALANEGKAWDADKKEIVNLKPKVELKPFDKVLVRDSKSEKWRANLLGYIDKDEYYHCVYANWVYCIPYIGNESLLGTTKDVEG